MFGLNFSHIVYAVGPNVKNMFREETKVYIYRYISATDPALPPLGFCLSLQGS